MKTVILSFCLGVIQICAHGSNPRINRMHFSQHQNDQFTDIRFSISSKFIADSTVICDSATSHIFPFDSAAILIANFASSEKGKKFVKQNGLGNYISFSDLYMLNLNSNPGYFFYDCYEDGKAYFAIKSGMNCKKNYRASYAISDNEKYKITSLYYSYWRLFPSLIEPKDIEDYLKNQQNDTSRLRLKQDEILGKEVRFANNEFINELGGGNYHSSHGYSFFNKGDFERLKSQDGAVGVAIFRGLDVKVEDGITQEYDRIILIAVNADGTFMNNLVLERSWPPKRLNDGIPQ